MTTKRKWAHALVIAATLIIGTLVEALTKGPWAHAGWAAAVLPIAKLLQELLADVPPVDAALIIFAFLGIGSGIASCAHLPPGVNVPMCGLDVLDDVGSALVCNLADHVPLPACVLDGLPKIATDHNCDVSGIVQAVAGNADRNAVATGDYLEAVKAQRARAWLAAQPPNPADVPPLHDQTKGAK